MMIWYRPSVSACSPPAIFRQLLFLPNRRLSELAEKWRRRPHACLLR